jgi:hypothetical protein
LPACDLTIIKRRKNLLDSHPNPSYCPSYSLFFNRSGLRDCFMPSRRSLGALVLLGLLAATGHALTKSIKVALNSPTQAVTTWYFLNCNVSLGVGSYSVVVAPVHGTLSYSTVSGPLPGCPAGSASLPAAAAFYTWTDTASGAACDYFQLDFLLNGQVAEVDTVTVSLATGAPISISTSTLPTAESGVPYTDTLTSTGPSDPVTWSVTAGSLPAGFTLSSGGVLSSNGSQSATAGTYSFTATAASVCQSASQQLTLNVVPESCAVNASVDPTKIHVTPASIWSLFPDPVDERWRLIAGNLIFGIPFDPYSITITADPDAVTYSGPSVTDPISYKFIQNLNENGWTGYATYQNRDGSPEQERNAILGTLDLNGVTLQGPLVDDNGDNPPYYDDKFGYLSDSPGVSAPYFDDDGRRFMGMHYSKSFTAYYGCHTSQDLTAYPSTDPRHFLHTLAKITWRVNYFGTLSRCFALGFSCFDPDTSTGAAGTATGPGVSYDIPQVDIDDPAMVVTPPTAGGNTNYLCFGGTGLCY